MGRSKIRKPVVELHLALRVYRASDSKSRVLKQVKPELKIGAKVPGIEMRVWIEEAKRSR
jgi:hypothetical protein